VKQEKKEKHVTFTHKRDVASQIVCQISPLLLLLLLLLHLAPLVSSPPPQPFPSVSPSPHILSIHPNLRPPPTPDGHYLRSPSSRLLVRLALLLLKPKSICLRQVNNVGAFWRDDKTRGAPAATGGTRQRSKSIHELSPTDRYLVYIVLPLPLATAASDPRLYHL